MIVGAKQGSTATDIGQSWLMASLQLIGATGQDDICAMPWVAGLWGRKVTKCSHIFPTPLRIDQSVSQREQPEALQRQQTLL